MSGSKPRNRLLHVVAAFAAAATLDLGRDRGRGQLRLSRRYPRPGGRRRGDDGNDPASPTREGLALAGQMGGHRGGWYSWDRLDNNGEPSAARIVPEWQSLKEGQHLYRVAAPKWQPGGGVEPEGPNWWTVAVVEPNRTLVLQTSYALPSGQGFDPASGPTPPAYVEGLPLAPGAWRHDPPGDPHSEPKPPPSGHPADDRAHGRARALHHANASIPQPARSRRRRGVT
jgi:hypothetical protein